MQLRTRRVGKHRKACWAMADVKVGKIKHPWSSVGQGENRDTLGRQNGFTTWWIRFYCRGCFVELLVRTDDILDAVAEGGAANE